MASSSMKLPPGATLEGDDGSMPLPPGATLVNDQSSSTPNAADQNQNKELPPTKVGTMPRAGEVWSAINEPLIPEGKAEKEGHEIAESAPSRWDEAHPTLSGIKKGVAGAYADTQGFIRGLTSPLGVATLGLGEVGETPGALGRIAKVGSRIAGAGFGAQGAEQTAEDVKDIATNGITPENTNKTLSGLGSVAFGGAAAVHGTKVGNATINPETVTKIAAAPIRAVANKVPTSPVAMKEFGLPGHERTARTLVGNDFVPKATAPVPVAPSPSPLGRIAYGEPTPNRAAGLVGSDYTEGATAVAPAKEPNPLGRIEYAQPTPSLEKPITPAEVKSSPGTSMSKPAQDLLKNMLTDEPDKKTKTPITQRVPDKTEPLIPEQKAPESPLGNAAAVKPIEDQITHAADLVEEGLGGKPLQPKISLKDQLGKSSDEPKLSSRPDKAVLQKSGASEDQISKILPLTNIELRQLAGKLGEDMGDSNIGRGKGDMAAGTHRSREQVLENILKNHSVDEIEKSIDRGDHLPTISSGQSLSLAPSISKPAQKLLQRMITENDVIGERVAKPRTPGEPLEHGFNMKPAEDLGNAAREGAEKVQGTLPRGERRAKERSPEEIETQKLFKQARTELGDDASTDEVMERVEELKAKSPRREAKPLILEEKPLASPYLGTALGNAEPRTGKDALQSAAEPLGSLSERVFKALKLSEPAKSSLRNLVHTGTLDEDTLISTVVRSTPRELERKYGNAA